MAPSALDQLRGCEVQSDFGGGLADDDRRDAAGCVWFVVQVLEGWKAGVFAGGALMAMAFFLLVIFPRIVTPRSSVPAGQNHANQ